MYLCHITLLAIGMTEAFLETIRSVPLPPGCMLEMNTAKSLEAAAAFPHAQRPMLLLHDNSHWTPALIDQHFDAKTPVVLCTEHPEHLSAARLARLHHVWSLPLSTDLLRFHFQRLLEELHTQKELWNMTNCLETIVNTMPGFIWFKDMEGHHLKVNQAFCEMVGKPMKDVVGKKHYEIWGITPEQYAEGEFVCLETDEAIAEVQQTTLFHEQVLHSRLGLRQLETYKSPIFDENGQMIGSIGVAEDVTAEYANRERILHLSRTDELTRLANRRYFYQHIQQHRTDGPLTLCYLDLDHFKQLNDTFGHQFGDAALMALAELMQKVFPNDFITRLGGDEFVIAILRRITREELCRQLDTLCQDAADFFQMDPSFRDLAMSMGISSTEDTTLSLDVLLQQSDDALYYSKKHCRGRYTFYEDIEKRRTSHEPSDIDPR